MFLVAGRRRAGHSFECHRPRRWPGAVRSAPDTGEPVHKRQVAGETSELPVGNLCEFSLARLELAVFDTFASFCARIALGRPGIGGLFARRC